jgi:acetolactate synthase-1/2/3 large subunit
MTDMTAATSTAQHPPMVVSATTTAGRAVVDVLRAEGVRFVFGLPGGHVLDIYDGLYGAPDIEHILVRHEHAAAAMAAGYAQLTGEPGVCLVTAGPGVTNVLTAVGEAYVGCLPMVVIAGRGATATTFRGASQELPTDRVFAPVTKWAVRIDRADLVADVLRQAFSVARSGKPGPVLVEIPRDVLGEDVTVPVPVPAGVAQRTAAESVQIGLAAERLCGAKRPIIVAGGGVVASGAFSELVELAEQLNAPVLTSLAGRGSIPDDHRLSVGGLGAHRNPVSGRLLEEADVVLGLGTRWEEMETNWRPGFVPGAAATFIQVDIDATEIGKAVAAQLAIVGDIRTVARQLLAAVGQQRGTGAAERVGWLSGVSQQLADLEVRISEVAGLEAKPLHPLAVIRAARAIFPRETTVAIDVGCLAQHIAGAFPYFKVYEPRSLIVPSSFYGMGFAAAAAPVAKLVHPDRPALCFVGDGSFQMSMHILPVALDYRLPVTWCVLNDGALGSIRDIQTYRYGGRYLGTEFRSQPDFAALAQACGCFGRRVETAADLETSFADALTANNRGVPAVLDIVVAPERLQQTREHYTYYPLAYGEL